MTFFFPQNKVVSNVTLEEMMGGNSVFCRKPSLPAGVNFTPTNGYTLYAGNYKTATIIPLTLLPPFGRLYIF